MQKNWDSFLPPCPEWTVIEMFHLNSNCRKAKQPRTLDQRSWVQFNWTIQNTVSANPNEMRGSSNASTRSSLSKQLCMLETLVPELAVCSLRLISTKKNLLDKLMFLDISSKNLQFIHAESILYINEGDNFFLQLWNLEKKIFCPSFESCFEQVSQGWIQIACVEAGDNPIVGGDFTFLQHVGPIGMDIRMQEAMLVYTLDFTKQDLHFQPGWGCYSDMKVGLVGVLLMELMCSLTSS